MTSMFSFYMVQICHARPLGNLLLSPVPSILELDRGFYSDNVIRSQLIFDFAKGIFFDTQQNVAAKVFLSATISSHHFYVQQPSKELSGT